MATLEQSFQEFLRQQRAGNRGSARDMLRLLGFVSLIASGLFWFPVQWELVGPKSLAEQAIAASFGMFLVLGPPVLVSFFVPWSPAARLLSKINWKTMGQAVALGCALFLLYYAGNVLYHWWYTRPNTVRVDFVAQQTIVGIIATIITPALLWAPVSSDELEEVLKQDQLVKRYEMQAKLDIAYLQSMVLEAQRLTAGELAAVAAQVGGPELAQRMRWLLGSIDQTIGEIAHTVGTTAGTIERFPSLTGNQQAVQVLEYVGNTLQHITQQPLPAIGRTIDLSPVGASAHAPVGASAHPSAVDPEALDAAIGALGGGAWKRAQLEAALSCEKTKASTLIKAWIGAGYVVELTDPRFHYAFTMEAAR